MTVIVLDNTAEQQAARYAALLASIGHDPSRFGELSNEDAEWCVAWLHSKLLLLVQAMLSRASDAECEASIAYWLACGSETLDRAASLAVLRMQRGLPQTLRDLSAMWVTNCAIKNQLAFELERRQAGRMN